MTVTPLVWDYAMLVAIVYALAALILADNLVQLTARQHVLLNVVMTVKMIVAVFVLPLVAIAVLQHALLHAQIIVAINAQDALLAQVHALVDVTMLVPLAQDARVLVAMTVMAAVPQFAEALAQGVAKVVLLLAGVLAIAVVGRVATTNAVIAVGTLVPLTVAVDARLTAAVGAARIVL